MSKGFKVETGQVTFRPRHALSMTALTIEQKEIQAKLDRHERALRHLKRTNPALYRQLKKELSK